MTLGAVLLSGTATSAEADWEATPDAIWDVTTRDESTQHTARRRALVWDMAEFDGRMYVAGKFREVRSPNGITYSQPFLAAFDVVTGEWDSSFRPTTPGIVYALAITDDGRLYAAGEFVGGVAAFDARTGTPISGFAPEIDLSWGPPAVYDIEAVGGSLYLAGNFSSAPGVTLSNFARIDRTTGAIDPSWAPLAGMDEGTPFDAGQLAYALAVDSTRDRVYLAGKFGSINGNTDAAYFATVDPNNGQLIGDLPQGLPLGAINHREIASMTMEDVQFDRDLVYLGGSAHQTMVLDADDLSLDASFFTNEGIGDTLGGGDTQVITVGRSTVWSGCHCWGSVGPYLTGSYAPGRMTADQYWLWLDDFRTINPFGQQPVRGGFGLDRARQSLVPLTFDLSGQAGAHAIVEDSLGRIWFGGEFGQVPSIGRPVDGIVRFSPTRFGARSADEQIVRLYRAVFGRAPDSGGFDYWTGEYRGGTSLSAIADSFTASPEWRQRSGDGLSNDAYVGALYRNVLDRDGDPEGVRYWIGLLDGGTSRTSVLLDFVDSNENLDATGTNPPLDSMESRVLRLYRAAFGRSPDQSGFDYWVGQHRGGQPIDVIGEQFLASDEWAARFGASPTNTQLVDALYLNVLGRPGDQGGIDYWVGQLQQQSIARVLVAFADSPENLVRTGTVR